MRSGSATFKDLGITTAAGAHEDCVEYDDCAQTSRWCLYDGSFGHQVPATATPRRPWHSSAPSDS